MAICVACHPRGTYSTAAFKTAWTGRPLSELFDLVKEKMPKNDPASLTPDRVRAGRRVSAQDQRRPSRRARASARQRGVEEDSDRDAGVGGPSASALRKLGPDIEYSDRDLHRMITTNRITGIAALLLATLAFAGNFTVSGEQSRTARARPRHSCAATRRANGATGAPTRGARATRRSTRSTRRTSAR